MKISQFENLYNLKLINLFLTIFKFDLPFSNFQILSSIFKLTNFQIFKLVVHFQISTFSNFQILSSIFKLTNFQIFKLVVHFQISTFSNFQILSSIFKLTNFQIFKLAVHFQISTFSNFQILKRHLFHLGMFLKPSLILQNFLYLGNSMFLHLQWSRQSILHLLILLDVD